MISSFKLAAIHVNSFYHIYAVKPCTSLNEAPLTTCRLLPRHDEMQTVGTGATMGHSCTYGLVGQ